MKSTGIVRRLDTFGRVVLPMELRKLMNLDQNSSVELFVEGDSIILRKYTPACIFCGSFDGIKSFEGRMICESCIKQISGLENKK